MQKIQYYTSDLARYLDIGEIADMHVITTDSGAQVLRITCVEKEADEYETVKTTKRAQTAKPVKPPARKQQNSPRHSSPPNENPAGLGGKIMDGLGKVWANKNPPDWMTRRW
ncbi:hypothetical protein M0R72_15160 [Candidatus Pacearchaeota archaeon]|jgi:hypothetical protein|nr:hypothetical protein [Candidatus Pacearchaeota archaeon]